MCLLYFPFCSHLVKLFLFVFISQFVSESVSVPAETAKKKEMLNVVSFGFVASVNILHCQINRCFVAGNSFFPNTHLQKIFQFFPFLVPSLQFAHTLNHVKHANFLMMFTFCYLCCFFFPQNFPCLYVYDCFQPEKVNLKNYSVVFFFSFPFQFSYLSCVFIFPLACVVCE